MRKRTITILFAWVLCISFLGGCPAKSEPAGSLLDELGISPGMPRGDVWAACPEICASEADFDYFEDLSFMGHSVGGRFYYDYEDDSAGALSDCIFSFTIETQDAQEYREIAAALIRSVDECFGDIGSEQIDYMKQFDGCSLDADEYVIRKFWFGDREAVRLAYMPTPEVTPTLLLSVISPQSTYISAEKAKSMDDTIMPVDTFTRLCKEAPDGGLAQFSGKRIRLTSGFYQFENGDAKLLTALGQDPLSKGVFCAFVDIPLIEPNAMYAISGDFSDLLLPYKLSLERCTLLSYGPINEYSPDYIIREDAALPG